MASNMTHLEEAVLLGELEENVETLSLTRMELNCMYVCSAFTGQV